MLILKQIFSFIELLHKETSPTQLCAGFVLGMFMGFTPTLTLHWFLYFVLMLILRINIGAALLSWSLFKILSFALDPIFHQTGFFALTEFQALRGLYIALYNAPFIPYTRFNNSIVMGSLIVSVLLALPLYWLSKKMVLKYRETVVRRVRASVVWRTITATKVYRMYAKYQELNT